MHTLTIGDSRTNTDLWGQPSLFAGVQFSTNFSLQPGYIYYPLPSISGEANIPSAVDIYINDVNRQRKNIQEGPFDILQIPTISGGGDIKVVQKDILGREKIYTVPYYLSRYSLKPGVKEYSVSLGTLRQDFGLISNSYKDFIFTANYRQGINKNFTGATRFEAKNHQQAAGLRSTYTTPQFGELSITTVISNRSKKINLEPDNIHGLGGTIKSLYTRAYKNFSVNLNLEKYTKNYVEVNNSNFASYSPRTQFQAFIGIPLKYNNSIALNYIYRDHFYTESEKILSWNYFHSIRNLFNLAVTGSFDLNDTKRKLLFITFSRDLPDFGNKYSKNITINSSVNIQNDEKTQYIVNLNKSPAEYNDFGYNIRTSHKDDTNLLADFTYKNQYNSIQLEYNYINKHNNYRLSSRGGIALFNNQMFVTRMIRDSFAVINTNNVHNVKIYHNNNLITQTNNNGQAIIPQLISYNKNDVSIDPSELPLNYQFDQSKTEIIPYRNTGTLLNFGVSHNYSLILKLIDKNNNPIRTGSHVIQNEILHTIVGYDGYVYLNSNNNNFYNTQYVVNWPEGNCKFELNLNPEEQSTDILQKDMGNIICS